MNRISLPQYGKNYKRKFVKRENLFWISENFEIDKKSCVHNICVKGRGRDCASRLVGTSIKRKSKTRI